MQRRASLKVVSSRSTVLPEQPACLLLFSVQLSEWGCAYSEHTLVKCQYTALEYKGTTLQHV